MVGAILTQNTAWRNASIAIERLKKADLLNSARLDRVPKSRLAKLIRSSGYFNQKAKRLKSFVRYFQKRYGGSVPQMRRIPLDPLRKELLSLPGIGPETADSILLYSLGKPIFVVDAYTRRILARHSLISWEASYEEIQALFQRNLLTWSPLFNEYHALLVALGKELCRTHPECHLCPLRSIGKLRLETSPAPIA
ncbi:MAG: endonuclease III domain-containing protein [Candidatus Omnitrophica bacterium]|nr:endonuclease III domain-containing protein [Candidatus Omnitrophota bacterium]